MSYHFRFQIPQNADGSRVSYSPDWHGTMPKCQQATTVLLYNDKEGWGIARTDDSFIPPEVKVITEAEATKVLSEAKDVEDVWFGVKLADRWLPEAETEDIADTEETLTAETAPPRVAVDTFYKTCPTCHKVVACIVRYDDKSVKIVQEGKVIVSGLIAKQINLVCPDGHKVKVILG